MDRASIRRNRDWLHAIPQRIIYLLREPFRLRLRTAVASTVGLSVAALALPVIAEW